MTFPSLKTRKECLTAFFLLGLGGCDIDFVKVDFVLDLLRGFVVLLLKMLHVGCMGYETRTVTGKKTFRNFEEKWASVRTANFTILSDVKSPVSS